YFTHKLMAALRFYGADWRFTKKSKINAEEVRIRSGTHQIPVLHTPENWMIADTTPILHMLDGRFPERRMFPEGALGVLAQIVERSTLTSGSREPQFTGVGTTKKTTNYLPWMLRRVTRKLLRNSLSGVEKFAAPQESHRIRRRSKQKPSTIG
ncbi:MAG: hypothetical protein AAFQ82_15290, partial [Myxococcota bacterium]